MLNIVSMHRYSMRPGRVSDVFLRLHGSPVIQFYGVNRHIVIRPLRQH